MKKVILIWLLSFLYSKTTGAEQMIIDNFNSSSNNQWQLISDQVMGGVSEGSLKFLQDGDQSFAQLIGAVSTENNGGFLQFSTDVRHLEKKDIQGIYLNVRGNNQTYYVHLRTGGTLLPWHYYASSFEVDKTWQIIRLPLQSFSPTSGWLRNSVKPTGIKSLGVVAFGRDHMADIQVAEIGFY